MSWDEWTHEAEWTEPPREPDPLDRDRVKAFTWNLLVIAWAIFATAMVGIVFVFWIFVLLEFVVEMLRSVFEAFV